MGDNPAGMTAALPSALRDLVESRFGQLLERCCAAGVPFYDDAGVSGHVRRVLAISDFAFDSFHRDPQLLAPQALALMSDPRPADARAHELDAGERVEAEDRALVFLGNDGVIEYIVATSIDDEGKAQVVHGC